MREVPLKYEESIGLSEKAKILLFAGIGNCLELYDYALYAVMLPFLAPLFFPSEEYALSLLFGYLSFAVAFIVAPIGSIFWGWFGDRFGRARLLRTSMIFMAIPSVAIAIMPTYADIGILAPVSLIILRVMQGISASGEVKGSKIFAMEYLGPKHYGIASGILSASGALGVLGAMAMAYLVSLNSINSDLWRLPFLLGGIIYIVAAIMRKMIAESVNFNVGKSDAQPISYLKEIVKTNLTSSKIVFLLGGVLGVLSYMMHAFIPPYISQYFGYAKSDVYLFSIVGYISTMIAAVTIGILASKNLIKFMINAMDVVVVTTPFLFLMLSTSDTNFALAAYIILGLNLGCVACLCSVVMYRVFPMHIRCRGVLFNYALGVGLFGGLTPAILQMSAMVNYLLPPIVVVCFILIVRIWFAKEVRNVDLY